MRLPDLWGEGKRGSERRRRRGKEEQTNGCVHTCRWAGVPSRGRNADPYEVVDHTHGLIIFGKL